MERELPNQNVRKSNTLPNVSRQVGTLRLTCKMVSEELNKGLPKTTNDRVSSPPPKLAKIWMRQFGYPMDAKKKVSLLQHNLMTK